MKLSSSETTFGDFRDDLFRDGYVVVKNVIPRERALAYQQKAFDWLKSFGTDLDLNNPDTWVADNLPVQSKINTFSQYGVSHEKFMWDARLEPGVIDAFAKIWGTDELLVSFDALNITFPNRKDRPRKPSWEHVDQSPFRKGMHCVQGIVNLSEAGPNDGGLMVYPRSHLYNEEFFELQTDKSEWTPRDMYLFSRENVEWFQSKGLKPYKVCAEPGDLILWESRLVHYGDEPSPLSNVIRTVIYVAYTPARLAKEEALKMKAERFHNYGATSHWPHDNISPRTLVAIRDDGTIDPKNRDEPIEKPELTDRLLQLAGVKPY